MDRSRTQARRDIAEGPLTTPKGKAPRDYEINDIEIILRHYGRTARVVVLWRRRDGTIDEWDYIGRVAPCRDFLMFVKGRFGGGRYRAKVYGPWSRSPRWEQFLEQATFGIAGPPTAQTVAKTQKG